MRVIHGRDYYDYAGIGVDKDIVFVRDGGKEVETGIPFLKGKKLQFKARKDDHRGVSWGSLDCRPTLAYLAVAGRIYPIVIEPLPITKQHIESYERITGLSWGTSFSWRAMEWQSSQKSIFSDDCLIGSFTKKRDTTVTGSYKVHYTVESALEAQFFLEEQRYIWKEDFEAKVREHFQFTQQNTARQWLVQHNIVTGIFFLGAGRHQDTVEYVLNFAGLDKLDFQSQMDGMQLQQELATYIGTDLQEAAFDKDELSDVDKSRKAGFDKQSFRKRKIHS